MSLDSLNGYVATPERRVFGHCGVCGKRRIFAQWWEVYSFASACNGQCRGTCVHGWTYACAHCTIKVAGSISDRLRFAADDVRIATLKDVLALDVWRGMPNSAHFERTILGRIAAIKADQQHDGY